jgi:sulfate adenylyltransferase subunit 2
VAVHRPGRLEVPSIYYSHPRQVFQRAGMLHAFSSYVRLIDGEQPLEEHVRYRTVGDMTCTGAVRSRATTLDEVVAEIAATRITERGETRADDRVTEAAMEDRKRAGYFLVTHAAATNGHMVVTRTSELLRIATAARSTTPSRP